LRTAKSMWSLPVQIGVLLELIKRECIICFRRTAVFRIPANAMNLEANLISLAEGQAPRRFQATPIGTSSHSGLRSISQADGIKRSRMDRAMAWLLPPRRKA